MKESITKFDLEAAFKALDEIDIPKVASVRANRPALTEIFSHKSKFDTLMEEYYNIDDTEGLEGAKDAREAEIAQAKLARIEKIVDLDAESAEDLLTSYVGKYIIQCPQCMMLFYKKQEDVEASEEDPTTVNVGEVCQHCGNENGYSLIGKVGEATPEESEEMASDVETEETSEEDLNLEIEDESTEEDTSENEASTPEGSEEDLDFEAELAELAELDLDIIDDEEEEKKEESFNRPDKNKFLAEELQEDVDLDVPVDDFEKLINSPEFKKPISDKAVRAMLDMEKTSDVEKKTLKTETTQEEALTEGKFADFGKALAKKATQAGKNIKKSFTDAIDNFIETANTREEKADWILANACDDYSNIELDSANKIKPNEANKRFNSFIVLGFEDKFEDGTAITKAPPFDAKDLVVGMEPETKDAYVEADTIAKSWSQIQGNGPAFIYLAKDIDDPEAFFMCEYFEGKLMYDQLDTYYKSIKKDIEAAILLKLNTAAQENTDSATSAEESFSFVSKDLNVLFEELDAVQESSLENIISNSLTESYKNVTNFKLNSCSYLDKKFIIEGTIQFKSGNTRKTTYTFTEAFINSDKTIFQGLNEKLGLDKQFSITGFIKDRTYFTETIKIK